MSPARVLAPDAAALMMTLVRDGGLRVDTLDREGVPALRTLLQADGNVVLFIREDCLTADALLSRHFAELERQIEVLLGMARSVEGRFVLLKWAVWLLYSGSGIASAGSTIASILTGKVQFVWFGVSVVSLAIGIFLRRAPSGWLALRALEHASSRLGGSQSSRN